MKGRPWTAHQEAILKKMYPRQKMSVIAKRLRRSKDSVKAKATVMGLKKEIYSNDPWTRTMERRLTKWYPNTRNKIIARRLGLREGQVSSEAFKLGLKKTPEFQYRWRKKGMFKPGLVPANKGKKMSKEQYKRCAPTMFKKGQLPQNTMKDGAITIREDKRGVPYKHIRVGLAKWVPYHRYRWELFRGKIPKGMIVAFKDGDTLNCKLSNLQLLTKYENRIRNSGSTLLSDGYVANAIAWRNRELADTIRTQRPDLIELKRQQLLLNREIKCKTKKKRSSSRRRKP